MKQELILKKLEGMQTVETAAETLGIGRQSTINLLSKLKKEGHVKTGGGGHQKRIYTITQRKQRKRNPGMFDIINKYSPMKINPWYDHQVHGTYKPEDAIIDAIETKSFRVILASLRLYNHITDWKRLYNKAKEKGVWQQVGALYDVARMFFRVRKMPNKYIGVRFRNKKFIIRDYQGLDELFHIVEKKWNVGIPFKNQDFRKVIS